MGEEEIGVGMWRSSKASGLLITCIEKVKHAKSVFFKKCLVFWTFQTSGSPKDTKSPYANIFYFYDHHALPPYG